MLRHPNIHGVPMKTIKKITTRRYEIVLVQLESGAYRIAYEGTMTDEPNISEPIDDYKTASMLFDLKLQELEGH